jgi:hypothetical protein
MGLNISLYGPGFKEHPDWDWIRHAGDRDFASMIGKELPIVQRGDGIMTDVEYRPADFAQWRKAIASREWPNPGRFEHLTDLLERNPDHWLYLGY